MLFYCTRNHTIKGQKWLNRLYHTKHTTEVDRMDGSPTAIAFNGLPVYTISSLKKVYIYVTYIVIRRTRHFFLAVAVSDNATRLPTEGWPGCVAVGGYSPTRSSAGQCDSGIDCYCC